MSKIKIILNGEEFFCQNEQTLLSLVEELHLDVKKIAVEKNYQIAIPENFDKEVLRENDRVEIVYFIGGG